ncbi:hypothetical protein [Sphingobacterium sp. UBA6645]|uniref:hypothetical protein n=1 Tax=Sphingobacterium sp. UBA6645 TaxID=1947511 RepID=UPI0025E98603|nr:hypothetical protein [Sphingobacterium sp. UBA6645]
MENTKIEELKNILNTQEKWVKVHAAEFLIWEDHEIDFVKKAYLKEEKLFDSVPQYRIGIWRVLYQAAMNKNDEDKYLHKIQAAFQSGPDSLHALETLAKLKQPISQLEPQFANQVLHAEDISSFEIYGLWNLYHDTKIDNNTILEQLLNILTDQKQSDLNKNIVAYVLRFIEIPKDVQEEILQIDLNGLSKSVQVQLLATILISFDVEGQKYEFYKQNLMSLEREPNFYSTAILALADKGLQENANEIDKYAVRLTDSTASTYSPDHHATANYAWLKYHRLIKK